MGTVTEEANYFLQIAVLIEDVTLDIFFALAWFFELVLSIVEYE